MSEKSNDLKIIEQFNWVSIIKKDYESIGIPKDLFVNLTYEKYSSYWDRKNLYRFLFFGLLFSVLEVIKERGVNLEEQFPELFITVNVIVSAKLDPFNLKFNKLIDVLRHCRNATFHVPVSDLDRRRELMKTFDNMNADKSLELTYKKIQQIVEKIKTDSNYYELIL